MLPAGDPARKESILERSYESAVALARRATGPLSPYLESFVGALIHQQYVPAVVHVKARHALAWDRWLEKQGLNASDLDEDHVDRFARRRRTRGPVRPETRRAERHNVSEVLRFLCAHGVCTAVPARTTPADRLLLSYDEHLRQHRGLAATTIERYTTVALQFLQVRFGDGAIDLHALAAVDIIEFVQSQAGRLGLPGLKCVANAMRSFLRFAQFRGDVEAGLVAAVPAVPAWASTPALPRAISAEHARRAIDSCDLGTAIGLRDRAVLLLLARLGLRAHEIIALQLDDCDWDRGHLRVRGKNQRACVLPMPTDVGEAIAAYLQRGRPASDDRHLFLRTVAPIGGLMHYSDGVGSIVRYALKRANVDAPHRGSHQFRHALAVRMLQGGASLAEIGEVLRHRSAQSSSIYARVDLDALRPLALPWPGADR